LDGSVAATSGEQMGKTIQEILSDPQLPFVRKLQIAAASELVYWEERVFKFDFHMSLLGKRCQFFIKGYFFEEGNLRGVEIQSFRKK
jgi:hypothetical protein